MLLTPIATGVAQEVATEPSGFSNLTLLGNSDTIVSLPFTRPRAACGLVDSSAGTVVQVKGSPAWSNNQFVYSSGVQTDSYYFKVRSGLKEGSAYTITASGPNTLTLDMAGDNLNGLSANDRFEIIPYWTLATVFPGGAGIHESLSDLVHKSEVLVFDLNYAGINPSASKTYFFYQGNWQQTGSGEVRNDDVLWPDAYFIVRHRIATDTTLMVRGAVIMSKLATSLGTDPSARQDNIVALQRPVAVSLNDSGLITSGAFIPSLNDLMHADELLTFDNSVAGRNKSASATYFYYSGAWRRIGSGADVGSTLVFTPGTGVVIRKKPGTSSALWLNSPTY